MEQKDRLEELKKEISQLEEKQRPLIEEKLKLQDAVSLKKNKKLIGNCYKYHNSYGSEDKWWMYVKIIDANVWSVTTLEAQDCGDDRIEVTKYNHSASNYQGEMGYIKIPNSEFELNFNKILKKLRGDK